MSDKLPSVSGDTMIRFLKKYGFKRDRQQGGHIILVKQETEDGDIIEIVVPCHKELLSA